MGEGVTDRPPPSPHCYFKPYKLCMNVVGDTHLRSGRQNRERLATLVPQSVGAELPRRLRRKSSFARNKILSSAAARNARNPSTQVAYVRFYFVLRCSWVSLSALVTRAPAQFIVLQVSCMVHDFNSCNVLVEDCRLVRVVPPLSILRSENSLPWHKSKSKGVSGMQMESGIRR